MVENRLVGMKSHSVYETPGDTIMAAAIRELESLTLDREIMQWIHSCPQKPLQPVRGGHFLQHGIERIDMVENCLVGMKSHGVYETPGDTIMAAAVRELESLTLDREIMQWKYILALKYTKLVYVGRWFDPLQQSMDAFMEKVTETTTGSVTLKLYKGSVNIASRKSPYILYGEDISSFENGKIYNQAKTLRDSSGCMVSPHECEQC
uniref:argininosuccinate synthase n=2 Tax=Oryza TaxID=4527 RepID=A0A0D3HKV4_9ORYZ